MKVTKSAVTIGKGRVSSARVISGGETKIVVEEGGVLVEKTIPAGSVQPTFSGSPVVVGYGDDCFALDAGRLERRGGYEYVPY